MRWRNLVGYLTALFAAMAVAGVGFAQPPFGGPPPGGGPGPFGGPPEGRGPDRFIEEYAEQLGLDDATLKAIDQIVDESREKAQALHAELRDMHRAMRDLLSQDTPDESAVMQQADAIGKAETELHKHRLQALLSIRGLLTEEQRAELSRIREETRAQWLQPLIEACEGDVDHFCPDQDGRWARRRCLRNHWEDLSGDCRDAIESARGRGGHHHGRHGPGGMGEF